MKYLYLLYDGKSRYKIGVSKNSEKRLRQINNSMPNYKVKRVFVVWLFAADFWEKELHKFNAKNRKPHQKGSGKTEWFKFRFCLFPVLQIISISIFEYFVFLGTLFLIFCIAKIL